MSDMCFINGRVGSNQSEVETQRAVRQQRQFSPTALLRRCSTFCQASDFRISEKECEHVEFWTTY